MKIYIAGLECKIVKSSSEYLKDALLSWGLENIYVLSSFYFVNREYSKYIPFFKDFLLDSGAYSFMADANKRVDWNKYLESYIAYINENKIEKFFELDIDSIIGYERVKKLRHQLEQKTGRQCIPVWHCSRGLKEWFKMCDEYSYVAIGDIAIGHISVQDYKYFPYLIKEAHKRNCKVHGLGITGITALKKYHFDSVDSSTWTSGSRFGSLLFFKDGHMKIGHKTKGLRIKDWKMADVHNLGQFLKYQKYAENHL